MMSRGDVRLGISEAEKKWKAENTVFIGLRFQKSTDADIIKAISGVKSKQGEIKRLIRLGLEAEKNK